MARQYTRLTQEMLDRLWAEVRRNGMKVLDASKKLHINYSTAKTIIRLKRFHVQPCGGCRNRKATPEIV